MRRLYTVFIYLAIPYIICRLYWKGRHLAAYRQRIAERFSLGKPLSSPVDVWIHAVSLGEVVAAIPLIDALLSKQKRVLVTTMTPTGSQQVKARFKDTVEHQYLPYDLPWALRRFFKRMNAQVGIIMETELWPNLVRHAKLAKIPLLLANARLSDKAFKQYQKMVFFFKPVLSQFTAILAQSELDAKRFIALGAPVERVRVLGNMKFDLQLNIKNADHIAELKNNWGSARPIIIAASTHEGEESQLLSELARLRAAIPDLILLIAPRHPERFNTVYELSKQLGFNTGLRSQAAQINANMDVVVLDSLGELLGFYQISDYAFVGGSLVPIGGHNVLEPIAMNVPVFCGPFMQNSQSICDELCTANALKWVNNVSALADALITMHQNPEQRLQQIEQATAVLVANKGTVARHLEQIEALSASQ
ncbi:lipid IV(A) 3-deoxy-D-manno-octulosonic acid transferase [bacterium]|nr:lipid IV(A) 3-deoxy-D-manno-octulosonic acid transferase [bacterium]